LTGDRLGFAISSLSGQNTCGKAFPNRAGDIVAESLRDREEVFLKIGRELGIWNRGYDFPRACRVIFGDLDMQGKSLLEIGCGKGIVSLWASLHGASRVVGLEPLEAGAFDTQKCFSDFNRFVKDLSLRNAEIQPVRLQDYSAPPNSFDVVLSIASINHLDEQNCIRLQESAEAVESYKKVFDHIHSIMRPGGTLIVLDAARRNVFGDTGLKNPFVPNIEWHKHQQPSFWADLLSRSGFADPKTSWPTGRYSRYLRIYSIPQFFSYFGSSSFRLEMRRANRAAAEPSSSQLRAAVTY